MGLFGWIRISAVSLRLGLATTTLATTPGCDHNQQFSIISCLCCFGNPDSYMSTLVLVLSFVYGKSAEYLVHSFQTLTRSYNVLPHNLFTLLRFL